MKKFLLIATLIFITGRCHAQQADSTEKRLQALEWQMKNIQENIAVYDELYSVGFACDILAGIGTAIGASSTSISSGAKTGIFFICGTMATIGTGLIIAAHFEIGKCRNLQVSPQGIAYKF